MNDKREQAQVEEVFGLTGGELMDEPWKIADENGQEWTFHYWYEFPPSYVEREHDYTAHEFRTVVRDIMFGPPPEKLGDWTRVAIYTNSGEVECPGTAEGDKIVQPAQCNDENECFYCENMLGQEHGYIYLGDGWAEVVYQKADDDEEQES